MGIFDTLQEESTFSRASGNNYHYVVLQVILKEKFIGTGSGNLTELERAFQHLVDCTTKISICDVDKTAGFRI